MSGDIQAFGFQLHECGYYTADVEKYTKGLINIANEYMKRKEEFMKYQPAIPVVEEHELPEPDFEYIILSKVEVETEELEVEKPGKYIPGSTSLAIGLAISGALITIMSALQHCSIH